LVSDKEYKKAFICYIDDKGDIVDGFYDNVKINDSHVSFDTSSNRLHLPWARIIKIKTERGDNLE